MSARRKVLIIEDDKRWQKELSQFFEAKSFDVTPAANSDEAFDRLEKESYNLVTLDIGLPGSTSIAWKRIALHVREHHPGTKIFIVTGDPTLETAMEAINYYPISGYFSKGSLSMTAFQDKLKEIPSEPDVDARTEGTALERIEHLCSKFHLVAKHLENRHDKRSTLNIEDEYDVQDLLHALLTLYFDDVRTEDAAPTSAGGAGRIDFVLSQERIVMEVKKTRAGLGDKAVGEQLAVDIARYKKHPDFETLVCFVYDPEGKIKNPTGLISDLEGLSTDGRKVRVFIRPRRE